MLDATRQGGISVWQPTITQPYLPAQLRLRSRCPRPCRMRRFGGPLDLLLEEEGVSGTTGKPATKRASKRSSRTKGSASEPAGDDSDDRAIQLIRELDRTALPQ